MNSFDEKFWDEYYLNNHTPWDMGHVSPPLKDYFDQLTNKKLQILVPGAGHAWEAEYLWQMGFSNVYIVDISKLPLEHFTQRFPDFPSKNLIHSDFFQLNKKYDLIIEQTFFCALNPVMRQQYFEKSHKLLKPNGKLVGLLFNFPLNKKQTVPPYGGSKEEYVSYLKNLFRIKHFDIAYNSHPARISREYFIILQNR